MGMRPKDPFESLLERHKGMLFALCRHMSRRGTTAEDLVQEAAVALWRSHEKLLSLPPGREQTAWIWRVARNAAIDALRRTPPGANGDTLGDVPENIPAELPNEALAELHELIDRLGEPDRSIATLQLEGYSYEEIGAATGMTAKNVSVRLVRIKEKIRKQMYI